MDATSEEMTTRPTADNPPTFRELVKSLFYCGPEQYAVDDESIKKDTAFFLMPMAASCPLFVDARGWRSVLSEVFSENVPDEKKDLANVIKNLYKLTHSAGARLISSANGRDGRERQLALNAWKTMEPAPRANQEWYHTAMVHMVMDHVIFAYEDIDTSSADSRPLQNAVIPPFATITEMKKIQEKFLNWKETTKEFCDLWEQAYSMNNNKSIFPNVCETSSDVGRYDEIIKAIEAKPAVDACGDDVIRSLIGGLKQTHTTTRVNTILNNFCMAALALRALVLRATKLTNEDSVMDTQTNKKTFEELIQENPDIKQLTFVQKDDFLGLMRPLYVMSATSPIVMISNAPISSTSHIRVPLYAIVHCLGVPGLRQSAPRRNLEHSIARLVVDMAVYGPSIFERRMCEIHAMSRSMVVQASKIWIDLPPQMSNENGDEEEVPLHEDRDEVISRDEWEEQVQEAANNPNVTYCVVTKLAEIICPTKEGKKPARVDLLDNDPKWYGSVTRRLKRLVQKRARSDEDGEDGEGDIEVEGREQSARKKKRTEDDIGNNTERTETVEQSTGNGTEEVENEITTTTNAGEENRTNEEPSQTVEKARDECEKDTNTTESTKEGHSRDREAAAMQTAARETSAESRGENTTERNNVPAGNAGNSITASNPANGAQAGNARPGSTMSRKKQRNVAPAENIESDSEEDRDRTSDGSGGPANQLRKRKNVLNRGHSTREGDDTDSTDAGMTDTFGNAYQTENIWEFDPPSHKGTRIEFANIPEPKYDNTVNEDNDREEHDENNLPRSKEITWGTIPNCAITTWDKDGNLLERIRPLCYYRKDEEGRKEYHTTVVFSKTEWEDMDPTEQRRIFREKNVLVKANTPQECRRKKSDVFDTKTLARYVDIHSPLQALDCTMIPENVKGKARKQISLHRMVRSSIQQYTKHVTECTASVQRTNESNGQQENVAQAAFHVLNFLDIPAAQDIIDVPFDDTTKYLVRGLFVLKRGMDDKRVLYKFATTLTSEDVAKRWFLASGSAAWSDWHCDAAGMSSFIKINTGTRLWAISHEDDVYPGTWTEDRVSLGKENVDVIFLRQGDVLYLKPTTNQFDVTIDHSLAFGGQFYTFEHMRSTMKGLIRDHYIGKSNTTTELLRAPLLLMKALSRIAETLAIVDEENAKEELPTENDQDIADLVITVAHLDKLSPEIPPYSMGERRTTWQEMTEFNHDFSKAMVAANVVTEWMKSENTIICLKEAEDTFMEECEMLENRLVEKSKRKLGSNKIMKMKCLCGLHK